MPIHGFTESLRPERLGKIRLGLKVPSQQDPSRLYPRATNYFVVPPEVAEVYGEKPTEIAPVWLPSDDPDDFIRHHYEYWTQTNSLLCQGDGVEATAKMDTRTGALADKDTKEWVRRTMACEAENCPYYKNKQCRAMLHFDFLLPDVPGIGIWTLSTTSWNSARNIMSAVKQLQNLVRMVKDGHIAGVPVTLKLAPQEVTPPGGKKKTIQVVHLQIPLKLGEVVRLAQTPISTRFQLIAGPMSAEEIERSGIPEDLAGPFEEEVLGQCGGPGDPAAPTDNATAPAKMEVYGNTMTAASSAPATQPAPATASDSGRAKIKEADVRKLVADSFGADGWERVAVPMMKELGADSYAAVDADQAFKLWCDLKAEAATEEARQRLAKEKAAKEKAAEAAPAPAAEAEPTAPPAPPVPPVEDLTLAPPPAPPAKARAEKPKDFSKSRASKSDKPQSPEEKAHWNLRMRLTESLKEQLGGREQGIQWLKDNFQLGSTAEMTREQLEAALARISKQKPEQSEEESPF